LLKNKIEELTKENYKVLEDLKIITKTVKHNKYEISLLTKEISKYKKLDIKHQEKLIEINRSQIEKVNKNINKNIEIYLKMIIILSITHINYYVNRLMKIYI